MSGGITENRARLDSSAASVRSVFDARTVGSSHRRLAELLEPGQSVLDAGCGTGAITKGIAEAVGQEGRVVGIDNNDGLISYARETFGGQETLAFETADIHYLPYRNEFDIVTTARVLQWLADPRQALGQLIEAAKPGGRVIVLDYNHDKISWQPEPPPSMKAFYAAFLKWRSDAGMRNGIADELPGVFADLGLVEIQSSEQHEIVMREDGNFLQQAGIWADVAATRGVQMVADGYLSEQERAAAETEYRQWVQTEAVSQTMYMLAVEGVKPE
ncbi:methyltransferase domain-containing protein [Paenibacillus chitinolyticus]|uniref:Methyltransferase domain-containing protein n=1 Tax=Paenibacillus chitinolyticus TaxID=79263 RepID=A0A410WXJ0_9BACL|nr:methyltransferase domain-containing protein [Paenibacillus chitinolyticus]MCY9589768.1 methyltransferase domain-containing protein [Paenibacillus chitinolyticus]MCY9598231.1 methyltransferase domain-containing protein [Paenibacillus chitinolyticus]QAV19145.1 methyltransferase domain-containing protein [Paenibacillus chitinolyticus]